MACTADYYIIDDEIKNTEEFDLTELKKGFSVYEVIKIVDRIPLFIKEHIERLHFSASLKKEKVWCSDKYIKKKVTEIIRINKIDNGRLKFALRYYESENKFICFWLEDIQPSVKEYKYGLKIISENHERSNPNAKIINYKLRKQLKKLIKEKKVFETLLVNNSGKITECSKSNIFFIKDNKVYTSFAKDVLIGITRNNVFKICEKEGIPIIETDIYYNDLKGYKSVFLTGTSIGIISIVMIDKLKFKRNNAMLNKISDSYNLITEKYISQQKNEVGDIKISYVRKK